MNKELPSTAEKIDNLSEEELKDRLFKDPVDIYSLPDLGRHARRDRSGALARRIDEESEFLKLLKKEYEYLKEQGASMGHYDFKNDKGIVITVTLITH